MVSRRREGLWGEERRKEVGDGASSVRQNEEEEEEEEQSMKLRRKGESKQRMEMKNLKIKCFYSESPQNVVHFHFARNVHSNVFHNCKVDFEMFVIYFDILFLLFVITTPSWF